MDSTLEFELPNVGPGPDPLSLRNFDADAIVLLFHRDYYCRNCRAQVQRFAERYDEFVDRNAEVLSVLPEPVDRAARWQRRYNLPYPLLADENAEVSERFEQPVRFGPLGRLHNLIGRMPAAAVLNLRGETPELAYIHRGRSPSDRPSIDTILLKVDNVVSRSVDTPENETGTDVRARAADGGPEASTDAASESDVDATRSDD